MAFSNDVMNLVGLNKQPAPGDGQRRGQNTDAQMMDVVNVLLLAT